jgi:prepilin-type N-terminal cleavage/methylation domain-containing protein
VPKRQSSTGALRLPRASRHDLGESGFTLLEMIITVAVMSIVVGAVATAMLTVVHNQQATSSRVANSSSVQITSAVYVRDVQSALQVTTIAGATNPTPCSAGGNGYTFLLGLTWGAVNNTTIVSYWQDGSSAQVVRQLCGTGGPPSTVKVGTGLSSVTVTISPAPNALRATLGWTTTLGIASITMDLDAADYTNTSPFDLLATPRLTTGSGGGSPLPPPLLLLGSSNPVISCNGGGMGGQISVDGPIQVDSSSAGAVQLSGHPYLQAPSIYTADPTPSSAISGPPADYSVPPQFASPTADPYATLTPPISAGLPVYTGTSYQGPGVYTNTLTFSGNTTTTMATGTYILENGISVTGQASVTSQTAATGVPQGVLLYVAGGQISFGGSGTVNLSPLENPAPYPAPAQDLVIWQAASDTNTVNLSGNASSNQYQGTVYAPGASIGSLGNGGYVVASIVASSMSCAGNGTIQVIG